MAQRKVKVYGCHNRKPLAEKLLVQDGWIWPYREPKVKAVPVLMTKQCQYTMTDLGKKDTRCIGCKHKGATVVTNWAFASQDYRAAKAAKHGLDKGQSV